MPTSLTLRITEPATPPHPAHLHAAACQLFEQADTDHAAQRKPFAVGAPLVEEGTATWRLGWLPDTALPDPWPPSHVHFGESDCRVVDARVRHCSFAALAASRPMVRRVVHFRTPTYFSRNGRDVPLPDPVLVLRSLVQRWNTFAPASLAIADDLSRTVLNAVLLSGASVHTVRVQVGRSALQTGFVGDAELGITRTAAPGVSTAFAALLRFASIAGVGAQTTYGFGEVSPDLLDELPHPHPSHDPHAPGPASPPLVVA